MIGLPYHIHTSRFRHSTAFLQAQIDISSIIKICVTIYAHQSHNSSIQQVFVLLAQPLAIDVLAHNRFVLLAIIRKIGYLMVMLVFVMLLVGSIMI